jgi:microcompartment protein CcmL/EutN
MTNKKTEIVPEIKAQSVYDAKSQAQHIHYSTHAYRAPKLSKNEASTISSLILPEEKVLAYATERRIHGALLNPTIVLVTDKRTIIINRRYLRLKSDIAFIEHDSIASFRVVHSILFSSVHIRQDGTADSGKVFEGVGEGEIRGFSREGANAIADGINYAKHVRAKIKQKHETERQEAAGESARSEEDDVVSNWAEQMKVMHELNTTTAVRLPDSSMYCLSMQSAIQRATELAHGKETGGMIEETVQAMPAERIEPQFSIQAEVRESMPSIGAPIALGALSSHVSDQVEAEAAAAPKYQVAEEAPVQMPNLEVVIPSEIQEGKPAEQASSMEQAVAEQKQTEEVTKARLHSSTATHQITPDDLMIFSVRKARDALDSQRHAPASVTVRYPEPEEIIRSDGQSLFQGLLSMIKRDID